MIHLQVGDSDHFFLSRDYSIEFVEESEDRRLMNIHQNSSQATFEITKEQWDSNLKCLTEKSTGIFQAFSENFDDIVEKVTGFMDKMREEDIKTYQAQPFVNPNGPTAYTQEEYKSDVLGIVIMKSEEAIFEEIVVQHGGVVDFSTHEIDEMLHATINSTFDELWLIGQEYGERCSIDSELDKDFTIDIPPTFLTLYKDAFAYLKIDVSDGVVQSNGVLRLSFKGTSLQYDRLMGIAGFLIANRP